MNVWKCNECFLEIQGFHTECPNCKNKNSFEITDKHPLELIKPSK